MEQELIAVDDKETDWDWIQGKAEVLCSTWASIVLDLYEIDVEAQRILDFSNTLDDIIIHIKAKEKQNTARDFANLYSLLIEFSTKTEIEPLKKDTIIIKSQILNAYAYVETEEWDKVQENIINAEKKMTETMTEISKEEDQRKFNVNKTYILLEELKNSLDTKDKGIFYIKYKNLLEEMNNLI